MTSETRRRLLEKHRREIERWFAAEDSGPADDLSVEVESRKNFIDAVRDFDSGVAFAEQLTVRLVGESAHTGLLDLQLAPVLDGLRQVFQDVQAIDLGLVGIDSGSTVLRLRPVAQTIPLGDDLVLSDQAMPIGVTSADDVGRTLIKVVEASEGSGDLRRWSGYVKGLEVVSGTLDDHDLNAEFTWSSMGGSLSRAALTAVGRGYLRSLREATSESTRIAVSGRIVELRESGHVRVKAGTSRTSPSYDVRIDHDELLRMDLRLGRTVHMLVQETIERDRLGRERRQQLDFVQFLSAQDVLGDESE